MLIAYKGRQAQRQAEAVAKPEYQVKLRAWEKTWICTTCGTVFDPGKEDVFDQGEEDVFDQGEEDEEEHQEDLNEDQADEDGLLAKVMLAIVVGLLIFKVVSQAIDSASVTN